MSRSHRAFSIYSAWNRYSDVEITVLDHVGMSLCILGCLVLGGGTPAGANAGTDAGGIPKASRYRLLALLCPIQGDLADAAPLGENVCRNASLLVERAGEYCPRWRSGVLVQFRRQHR
jgi:hypothetical protein